jgi:hypothetical protein
MKLDKTFSIISRINQALLLLGLLSIIGLGIWGIVYVYLESHKPKYGEIVVKADKDTGTEKMVLTFSGFHKINGANTMMADISERKTDNYKVYSSSRTVNIMFISTKENKVQMLFPHSNYLILSSNIVTLTGKFGDDEHNPALGVIYKYVKADTNDDKVIDEEDRHAVGLAHADGTGAVEILSDFDSLLSSDAIDAETLSVIYQKGQKVISGRYSLKTFKLISSTTITDLLVVDTHG